MAREQTLIPVDMDQEDVALRFQKYALVSAAVIDDSGRLVGMITVDDVVHIIQEEAGEDVLLLSGAGEGDINEPVQLTVRRRLFWLVINLGTAILAASVVSLFQGEIGRYAVLAVLMPIVAGMGGNAGTQTLAVAVRALATNQLTESNTLRAFGRELTIALANGLSLGVLIGSGVALVFGVIHPTPDGFLLGGVIGVAMVINNLAAGLAGHPRPGHARPLRHRPRRVLRGLRHDGDRRDRLLQLPRPCGARWPWQLSHCKSWRCSASRRRAEASFDQGRVRLPRPRNAAGRGSPAAPSTARFGSRPACARSARPS